MVRPVLVIEDDPLQRKMYCEILRSQSYETIEIGDPRTVLDIVIQVSPIAAVIDILLPYIDGRALIESLREDERTHTLPILALSAVVSQDMAQTSLAAGANCFFPKPVPLEIFLRMMARLTA